MYALAIASPIPAPSTLPDLHAIIQIRGWHFVALLYYPDTWVALCCPAEVDREPPTESREAGGDPGGGVDLEAIRGRGIDVDRLGMEV